MPYRGVRHAPRDPRVLKRDEDMNLMEGGGSRKRQATLRFFDTLKSEHGDGFRPSVVNKPMRGGSVEARSQGRSGETLEEENAKRGSTGSHRVTPACRERTLQMRKPLESGLARSVLADIRTGRQQRHEGKVTPRGVPATGEGNPLKAKAQGRYRHETRLERLQVEQGVKRLRKPEDAAQPGQASPV